MISNRAKKYILDLTSRMVVAAGLLLTSACVDELPGNENGYITDGEVSVELQAAFAPFSGATLSRSESIPGKAMSDLSDLCLLAYSSDGKLIENDHFPMEVKFDRSDLKDEPRTDPDASNGDTAETSTKCLKKDLTLPAGRYYIIAVANLGKYTRDEKTGQITRLTSTYEALTRPGGEYYGQYATLDALRDMTVTWDLDNDANNRQMLGFFSTPDAEAPSYSSNFQMVDVNRNGISIRAWLRRCASKVTIDFDGSSLRENVRVYIKEARIYDIPKTCTLGFGYGAEDKSYNNAAGKDGIHTAAEPRLVNSITYGEGTDHKKWPAITKGTPNGAYIEDDGVKEYDHTGLHSETADALFFYENMQGEALYDKFQTADLNTGGVQNSEIEKDGVPYGTYIEVTGHYYSTANGAVSEGDIKYRFMLGKDAKRNCDAERNYHYKLTLKLRGNANDYDWHIDYKDTDGFDIPNPWYVSYLYNHDALLPFKFTPREGYRVDSITAKITKNPWYPTEVPTGEEAAPYQQKENQNDGNGFLSMWETDDLVITPKDSGYEESEYMKEGSFQYGWSQLATMNENYYLGNSKSTSDKNRSVRVYKFDGSTDESNDGREAYSYRIENGKYTFNIPLFTRAKVLIKQTGYSGNNPFVGYERHARLKVTAHCSKIGNPDETYTKDTETTVIQVRRIVNPKGVYRKSGNNQDFNVTLMRLPGDNEPNFVEFKSDGPWMAEIIGDKNFITLDGKQIVTGSTKTPIKFQIRFNKMNKEGDPVRNAVVRVRYHNYTCIHLIFVRQGYDPIELSANAIQKDEKTNEKVTVKATKWNLFNMIAKDTPATDPRDEGSMFKYANEDQPIDASCNVYTTDGKYLGTPKYTFPSTSEFNNPPALKLLSFDKDKKKVISDTSWDGIEYHLDKEFTMDVATIRDFEQLYLTPNIQFGYGVLYADGATTTQASVSDAYGWYRDDNDNTRGMRGMFVYYWDRSNPGDEYNARNMFFPIGRSGFGHRKHRGSPWSKDTPGTLRYSCNRNGYSATFLLVAPLFCNLHHRPGAIYWIKKRSTGYLDWAGDYQKSECAGLDINYFSFDVNGIDAGNLLPTTKQGDVNVVIGSDACFLRTVSR